MIKRLYQWMMTYADKPNAPWLLGALSFLESSVSPIPPDPLMIPMVIANPKKAWRWASLTTVTSVLGGAIGYAIGVFLFDTLGQWVVSAYGLEEAFIKLQNLFITWGFWIIVLKGLTPIPFKIVTITSGVTGLNFWLFMGASVLSRGLRFFAVAALLWKYGAKIRGQLEKNLTVITFTFLGLLIGGFAILKMIH